MLQLTIQSPESEAGQSCSISGSSVTIGRNRLNDLCLEDGTVSDFHAEIVPDGHGGWQVNDHDSSNGTFLNGSKVKSKLIRSGDTLAFGGVETVVEVAPVGLDADTDSDLAGELDIPEVAADNSPKQAVAEGLLPYSSLPTAQIEQAIAMHHARISGKVDTVDKASATEVVPDANPKDAPSAATGEIAQMHDRLKHALDELQALKDKHALQTRELEKYQERADLLEDPDADVTKLRIQISDIRSKCDQAERKLKERDEEITRLEKLSEVGEAAPGDEGISVEEHEAAVAAAAAKAKASGEKHLARQIEELCKQHRAEIKKLKELPAKRTKAEQSDRDKIEALEKRIEELTAEADRQQSKQEAQSSEVEKRDAQLARKTAEVKKLGKQVAELEGTVENLQGDDATSSDEVEKLSAERDEKAAAFEEKETALAELTASHEATAAKLIEAEAERDEIKTANEGATAELKNANAAIKKQEREQAKLEKRIAELESQIEQSDGETVAENEKLSSELERSSKQNAALEAQLKKAEDKAAELEDSIAGHEAELGSKVAALSVLKAELDEKEEEISVAEETEEELRASVAEQEKTISEQRAEIETLSGESGDVTEKLVRSRLKIDSLNDELATLKSQQSEVGAAGKIVEKLESEADELRDGMEELKQQREQMQNDLDAERIKLGRERVEIDAERVSLRATLKESENETEAARERLKVAEYEVEAKRRELDGELEEMESAVIIERRRAEELTAKAEAAEQRVQKAAELVEENAERWDKAEAGARKEERRLAGLRRKLVRRRKLFEKLRGIGRREQALKRKIAEAHEILKAAEEHKPGKSAPAVPRPWDVDKSIEDYEGVLRKTRELEEKLLVRRAEWEKIDKDIQAGRGPLGDKAKKIDVNEFSAAVARNEELESTIERLEIEKRSLIDTVSAMKAKIAAASAGAQGSVVP